MKKLIIIMALAATLLAVKAYAACQTIMIDGKIVTCCTSGNFTNCF